MTHLIGSVSRRFLWASSTVVCARNIASPFKMTRTWCASLLSAAALNAPRFTRQASPIKEKTRACVCGLMVLWVGCGVILPARLHAAGLRKNTSAKQRQEGTPTPKPGSANSYVEWLQDAALRAAVTQWLSRSNTREAPKAVEIKVLSADVQAALAKWIEKETAKPKQSNFTEFIQQNGVAVGAFLGVLLTILGNWLLARKQKEREVELADRAGKSTRSLELLRADIALGAVVRQNCFDRLQKFYAPLRALLQQTRGVAEKLYNRIYDTRNTDLWKSRQLEIMNEDQAIAKNAHMALALAKAETEGAEDAAQRAEAKADQDATGANFLGTNATQEAAAKRADANRRRTELTEYSEFAARAQVKADEIPNPVDLSISKSKRMRVYTLSEGTWKIVRVLDFMSTLRKDPPSARLVDEIISIGRKMKGILSEFSGLAATGQDLSPLYGEYLAHFTILESMYVQNADENYEPISQKVGYYPMAFDAKVEEDYAQARKEVLEYEASLRVALESVNKAS